MGWPTTRPSRNNYFAGLFPRLRIFRAFPSGIVRVAVNQATTLEKKFILLLGRSPVKLVFYYD